jgi:hypothetical protein
LAQGTGAELRNAEPQLALGRQGVQSLALPQWLELGLWAQTARIAAARHDAGFFRERASLAALERVGNLLELEGRATAELAAVRAVIPADGRIDWPAQDARWTALERSLFALLDAAGR